MKLKVKKAFKWAHRHVDVQEHNVGDVIDTDDEDLIRVATEEGWATKVKATEGDAAKNDSAAPHEAGEVSR